MRHCIDHRPAGHKPHPKLKRDGRFRIVHVEGKANTQALLEHRFGAYIASIERTYRRTAAAARLRIKKRARAVPLEGTAA